MDLTTITLTGLAGIGIVNVVSFFKPGLDSRIKFAISLVAVFAVTFIPVEVGNTILAHLKEAITVAFAASGLYKLSQNTGTTK